MTSVPPIHEVIVQPTQALHLGVGTGSGFSRRTHPYIPAATLRGAVAAQWWRSHPAGAQTDFDTLMRAIRFSDATLGAALPMDHGTCKRPGPQCPARLPLWAENSTDVPVCPGCGQPPVASKGERSTGDATTGSVARVALDTNETARDEQLFQREALLSLRTGLRALVRGDAATLTELGIRPGTGLRIGGAKSVAGAATIQDVHPLPDTTMDWPAGDTMRLELLTAGAFTDEFGFPTSYPGAPDLTRALGLTPDFRVTVVRAYTRWGVSAGWHSHASLPKPGDAVVNAHSVFHLRNDSGSPSRVPRTITDLGFRTLEGCGWARLTPLDKVIDHA